ncbi:MAG: hypothetical protein KAX99_08540, partial [Azonexus sp.]|nr:hypothetical protein [Azonexus sp.]
DGGPDGLFGDKIAEQRGREKAGTEQNAEQQNQAVTVNDFWREDHCADYLVSCVLDVIAGDRRKCSGENQNLVETDRYKKLLQCKVKSHDEI